LVAGMVCSSWELSNSDGRTIKYLQYARCDIARILLS
jgi:hypothetical protein